MTASPAEPARSPETRVPAVRIRVALAGLDDLDGRPPAEHVAVFEDFHAALAEALAAGEA